MASAKQLILNTTDNQQIEVNFEIEDTLKLNFPINGMQFAIDLNFVNIIETHLMIEQLENAAAVDTRDFGGNILGISQGYFYISNGHVAAWLTPVSTKVFRWFLKEALKRLDLSSPEIIPTGINNTLVEQVMEPTEQVEQVVEQPVIPSVQPDAVLTTTPAAVEAAPVVTGNMVDNNVVQPNYASAPAAAPSPVAVESVPVGAIEQPVQQVQPGYEQPAPQVQPVYEQPAQPAPQAQPAQQVQPPVVQQQVYADPNAGAVYGVPGPVGEVPVPAVPGGHQ